MTVNGVLVERQVPARTSLADFVRDELGLTGTHLGCEHGVCGACAVLVDGSSVRSCLMLAAQASGAEVTTVEGLPHSGRTARLRDAMSRHHGLQCGFCTSGFLITATELLTDADAVEAPDEGTVREVLSGNVCRCTGYQGIVRAVLEVAGGGATAPSGGEPAARGGGPGAAATAGQQR
ncbi:(2Fe-2S)-binding protein [Planosporangium thailandense]|uniref:(2Fe-2S)-binding protein n=2 Tax=Planosporangium thailandense TaxID=765197 RepID=A0ABX0Y1X0_9ACTN|nr:(2Fe-2S)-binding protein [Planosporangium thailandense]